MESWSMEDLEVSEGVKMCFFLKGGPQPTTTEVIENNFP